MVSKILFVHIVFGSSALITGAIALSTQKGGRWHRLSGQLYFLSMTVVFLTALIVAIFKFNRFLFLIAFLSYYSVFSGVRALKLKNLHKNQKPKWFDWLAGLINTIANIIFLILGTYYLLRPDSNLSGAVLSIGFA